MDNKIGLTSAEVEERIALYGLNKVEYFSIGLLEIIKRNALNFFNLLLVLACFLSLLLEGLKIETLLIFVFLFLSIFISSWQDYRSSKLAKKLLSYFKNYTLVIRDGQWQKILKERLVPGDYVRVSAGFLVPADIKILKSVSLMVDESIITGESTPLYKKENDIAYMGTMVVSGELEGEVVATGAKSYFGALARKTIEINKETFYHKILDDFAKKIGYLALVLILLIILTNFLKPNKATLEEVVIFAIVLSIAIVPEFLPAMTTLTLSLAGERLAKKGLLIKRLSSLEDLGSVEILCVDKTGTITTNELEFQKINAQNENEFLSYFLLDYQAKETLDPYEKAVLKKIKKPSLSSSLKLLARLPFDPVTRTEKYRVEYEGQELEVVKGAPEKVIELCSENIKDKEKWLKVFQDEDQNGLRTLALGITHPYQKMLGIASFFDPLKATSYEAVKLAHSLNVEVKILTGDSPLVARRVALMLGIISEDEKVVLGDELRKLNGEDLRKLVLSHKVFARVLPEDKLKIVEILQREKSLAFLGEGINDAPALKVVHSAIVVDTASDVAKEEADIILERKDLKLIVDGIYEGRKVLENIGKYLKHTMSDNIGNLTSVAFLAMFLPFVPLTPVQVLLTNFITDLPLIAFANDNVLAKEIKKPVKMSINHLMLLLLVLGTIGGMINIFAYLLVKNYSPEIIRTYLFYTTTLTGLVVSFIVRTKDWFFLSPPSKFFLFSSILGIVATFVVILIPIFQELFGFTNFTSSLFYASLLLILLFIIATEISKRVFYKYFPNVI